MFLAKFPSIFELSGGGDASFRKGWTFERGCESLAHGVRPTLLNAITYMRSRNSTLFPMVFDIENTLLKNCGSKSSKDLGKKKNQWSFDLHVD